MKRTIFLLGLLIVGASTHSVAQIGWCVATSTIKAAVLQEGKPVMTELISGSSYARMLKNDTELLVSLNVIQTNQSGFFIDIIPQAEKFKVIIRNNLISHEALSNIEPLKLGYILFESDYCAVQSSDDSYFYIEGKYNDKTVSVPLPKSQVAFVEQGRAVVIMARGDKLIGGLATILTALPKNNKFLSSSANASQMLVDLKRETGELLVQQSQDLNQAEKILFEKI